MRLCVCGEITFSLPCMVLKLKARIRSIHERRMHIVFQSTIIKNHGTSKKHKFITHMYFNHKLHRDWSTIFDYMNTNVARA